MNKRKSIIKYLITTCKENNGNVRQSYLKYGPNHTISCSLNSDEVGKQILERDKALFDAIKASRLETTVELPLET